ncbi:unnamed protein product [Effrenium voratum]|nr:unnamed protein product [Effrenium voratum]
MMQLSVGKLSGEVVPVQVDAEKSVAELARLVETLHAAPLLALVSSLGTLQNASRICDVLSSGDLVCAVHGSEAKSDCFKQRHAFALLRHGAVAACGRRAKGGGAPTLTEVVQLCATREAFAALRGDGGVATWGSKSCGGDSGRVANQLQEVRSLRSTDEAFVGLTASGAVVAWGDPLAGGSAPSAVTSAEAQVAEVVSTRKAFAALRRDGTVVAWGDPQLGGDASEVQHLLTEAVRLFASGGAFAALKADGALILWGDVAIPRLSEVVDVATSEKAFCCLVAEGSVVVGPSGGTVSACHPTPEPPRLAAAKGAGEAFAVLQGTRLLNLTPLEVPEALEDMHFVELHSTSGAFCGLTGDGRLVAWGDPERGGARTETAEDADATKSVVQVVASLGAFAALRSDGSVTAWGHAFSGGNFADVQHLLSEVVRLEASEVGFLAVKQNDTAVVWGHPHYLRCGLVALGK